MNITQENVTPALASSWLKNKARNRSLKPARIAELERAIRANEFMQTGDGIKFNKRGQLIDGQNRLEAIRRSGHAVDLTIVRGLDDAAMAVIDTGSPRRLADHLRIRGYKDASTLSAATAVVWRAINGVTLDGKSTSNPSILEGEALLERFPEIIESVRFAGGHKTLLSTSRVAPFHFIFSRVDPEAAKSFFDRLQKGENLSPDDPVFHLRNRLLQYKLAKAKPPKRDVYGLVIKAFNMHVAGVKTQHLAFRTKGKKVEEFPQIVGLSFGPKVMPDFGDEK